MNIWEYFSIDSLENETWMPIPGYEGYYEASSLGRIKTLSRVTVTKRGFIMSFKEKILSQCFDKDGYLRTSLTLPIQKGVAKGTHIWVALAFKIENPDNKPQINHKDGVKTNNSPINLEWATNSDNQLHARRIGLNRQIAGDHTSAKITNEQAIEIFNSDLSYSELSNKYGVKNITLIKTGKTWSSVTGKKLLKKRLSKEIVCDIFISPMSTRELCNKYNIKEATVRRIKTGNRYGNITKEIK